MSAALVLSLALYGEPTSPAERSAAVRNFFLRHESPLAAKAELFVEVAGQNGLDWRLLPGLAMVETSGGKHSKRNNIFGWNSGKTGFKTVDAGIRYVGQRLAHSRIYSGGATQYKLSRYNPDSTLYPAKVIKFMKELSSAPID